LSDQHPVERILVRPWQQAGSNAMLDADRQRFEPLPPPLRLGLILGVIGFDPLHFDKVKKRTRVSAPHVGFLTAPGKDIEITGLPTRKPHEEVSVVA
jgi:hypothetical protein